MRTVLKILVLILVSFGLKAQTLPAGLPNPKSPTSYYWIGWLKADSGIINALRNTSFTPLYAGTQVFQIRPGVDSLPWWWTGSRWITFPTTGGGGNFNSFSFTPQNGITGTVTNANGPNVALALGTNLNGIVKANGSGFGTVVVGSGLTYDGTTLSAGTNINALISGNGTNFIATTIGAGLSYSTVTHTLSNTITNNNQLTNGAGYISNVTGYIQAGTNIAIAGAGTLVSPYVISSTGGGSVTGAGNLSPLFTTSVSVGTINFAFTNPAAFTIFGNPTSGSASPVYFGINSTLAFSGNLLGVNTSAPLNFYQTVSQIDSFTFTLNTPTGRHDTVRIVLPTNGFISNLNNGLTLTGSLGQLGGPLVQNTLINGGGFSLGIQGNRFATGMGAAIASANNLTTGSDGNLFSVTGLTQINAITTTNWQAGAEIAFIFTSTPILKNNTVGGGGTAPMLLAGSIDYQAAPGDYIKLQYDGAAWHEVTRKLTSAGGAYIFSNGITESPATRVKLGGTLTQNTTLAGASAFYLAISNGRFEVGQGAAVAAASNLAPGNDGNVFSITGNTQINALSTLNFQAGTHIELIFTGTPTLKQNTVGGVNTAPMLLAGSVDYTAAAGDLIGFTYDGTNWHETNRKLAGSVTNLTFNNGLTLTGTTAQLGGALVKNTSITNGSTFNLSVTGSIANATSGWQSGVFFVQNTASGALNRAIVGEADDPLGTAIVGNSSGGTAMWANGLLVGITANGNTGVNAISSVNYGVYSVGTNSAIAVSGNSESNVAGLFNSSYAGSGFGSVQSIVSIIRSTSGGSPTNGVGGSLDFSTQTTVQIQRSNQLISKWTDVTDATRTSQFYITGVNNAATNTLVTIDGDGGSTFLGPGTPTNTVRAINTTSTALKGETTSGNAVFGVATTGVGGQFNTTSGSAAIQAFSTTTLAANFGNQPSSTNTVVTLVGIQRGTSGTAANGIGLSIDLSITTTTTSNQLANQLISKWTNATHATRTSQFSITGVNSGSTINELLINGNGTLNAPQVANWGNFANNAAAITGGLVVGDLYRNGDVVQIVH